MTKQHTPTPWASKPSAGHEIHGQSIIWDDSGKTIAVTYTDAADAAYIVRACNAHDELVAALDACVTELSAYYDGRNDEDADTDEALTLAAAALAKARA